MPDSGNFFWLVPLSFRSLVDNALGPRDRHHLMQMLIALEGTPSIECAIASGDRAAREALKHLG